MNTKYKHKNYKELLSNFYSYCNLTFRYIIGYLSNIIICKCFNKIYSSILIFEDKF